jgi:multidrug resistance efflux pump
MTEPQYHKQPTTFDPTKDDIPEEAPLAQGHSRELADEVREADIEHTEAVRAENEQASEREAQGLSPQVGPREPGDHAGEDTETDTAETTYEAPSESEDVPQGSVEEIKTWAGDDPERAQRALDAERAGQNRSTLVAHLEGIVNC